MIPRLIQIRNNKVISIVDSERNTTGYLAEKEYFRELGSKKIGGNINSVAKRKIESRFEAWYETLKLFNSIITKYNYKQRLRFVLITLTLPVQQFHSDKYLKLKLLKPFVKTLEKRYKAYRWMWRAEKQKNGNIHFHIVIDQFIDYKALNDIYFHYLKTTGYLQKYQQKHPGKLPPALNVTGQKKMINPVSYLTKYLSKKSGYQEVDGALWRMSNTLVTLKPFMFYDFDNYEDRLRQLVEQRQATVYEDEYFTIYHAKRQDIENLLTKHVIEQKNRYYTEQVKNIIINAKPTYFVEFFEQLKSVSIAKNIDLKPCKQLDLLYDS